MANIKAVRKTVYRCTVCGAEYKSRRAAEKECGSYELEPPLFKIGDPVRVWHAGKFHSGEVIKVIGPIIGNSFKDGKRRFGTGAHVYQYEVAFKRMNGTTYANFWTSELGGA